MRGVVDSRNDAPAPTPRPDSFHCEMSSERCLGAICRATDYAGDVQAPAAVFKEAARCVRQIGVGASVPAEPSPELGRTGDKLWTYRPALGQPYEAGSAGADTLDRPRPIRTLLDVYAWS